ncbi:MAG: hypothetical protein JSR99_07935 [Proteobacteria bacterium]|nr:hypothetical protein [Pseudomonadota bacterium]
MNVDEPTVVGLVDIVSTMLARLTAAVPMRGPIEVDGERPCPRKKRSWDVAAVRLDRNVCVDVGSEMTAGYAFADRGEGIVELPVAAPGVVIVVVCCTDPRDTPGSVGTSELGVEELESGFNSEAELEGSI